MIEREQQPGTTPAPTSPGPGPAPVVDPQASAQVPHGILPPVAAQGPCPQSLLVFEPAGLYGGPESLERILKSDHHSTLAEKLEQASLRHAEAVANAITEALQGSDEVATNGRFSLVEKPDGWDCYRFRFEGLRLSFPFSNDPAATWDLSITASWDLKEFSVEAHDAKEGILQTLEEWSGVDVRPIDVGKDVAAWVDQLPEDRERVLRKRRFP